MTDLWHQLTTNPWVMAYVAGLWTGWAAARRVTRYMVAGGR